MSLPGLTGRVPARTEPVRLRPTAEEDLAFVMDAERHEENSPFVVWWARDRHQDTLSNEDQAHLILERTEDARAVGYVILAGLANVDASIEFLRIVVTEKGRGYGRAALRLVKKLAFEELGAHRLWLDVKEYNHRARRAYESEGFVVEGTLRECLKAGDAFESLVVMSILESEHRA